MGLIIDSSGVIEVERSGGSVQELVKRIVRVNGNQEAALCSVGFTELAYGAYWTKAFELRRRRLEYLDELLDMFPGLSIYKRHRICGCARRCRAADTRDNRSLQ